MHNGKPTNFLCKLSLPETALSTHVPAYYLCPQMNQFAATGLLVTFMCWGMWWMVWFPNPGGGKKFFFPQNVQTGCGVHPASYLAGKGLLPWGWSSYIMKLTSHRLNASVHECYTFSPCNLPGMERNYLTFVVVCLISAAIIWTSLFCYVGVPCVTYTQLYLTFCLIGGRGGWILERIWIKAIWEQGAEQCDLR